MSSSGVDDSLAPSPPDRAWRIHDLFIDQSDALEQDVDRHVLKQNARWIRDELDPLVARAGPDVVTQDQVIMLFMFMENLRKNRLPVDQIRWSRIHLAILLIAGKATRWPSKLVTEADLLIDEWTQLYGSLQNLGVPLYEEDGRLHGICAPEDLNRDILLVKWLKIPGLQISPSRSRKHGDLGFKPGDWWINAMCAYREGIIDSGDPSGGVVYDAESAYALVLTHSDEVKCVQPCQFTYRTRADDAGRYKLTAGTPASRQAIRVLRSHTLRSFWAPRTGLRYEGLYKVLGWSITFDATRRLWTYDIEFRRLETEGPIANVLLRPWEEEVDDYKEYKRIRQMTRGQRNTFHRAKPLKDTVKNKDVLLAREKAADKDAGVAPDIRTSSVPDTIETLTIPSVDSSPEHTMTPPSPCLSPKLWNLYSDPFSKSPTGEQKSKRIGSVPMHPHVKEALEVMRKQSIDEIAPFAWHK